VPYVLFEHLLLSKIFGTIYTSRTEIGQLDFVNRPNVSTLIQESSSVVMICIQGKHFCTCGDGGVGK